MEGQQNASIDQIYKTPMGGTDSDERTPRIISLRGKPSRTRANIRSGNTHIIKDFFERADTTPANNTVEDERPWRSAKIRKFRNRVPQSFTPSVYSIWRSETNPYSGDQKQIYVGGKVIVNTKLVEGIHLVNNIVNRKISQRGIEKKQKKMKNKMSPDLLHFWA